MEVDQLADYSTVWESTPNSNQVDNVFCQVISDCYRPMEHAQDTPRLVGSVRLVSVLLSPTSSRYPCSKYCLMTRKPNRPSPFTGVSLQFASFSREVWPIPVENVERIGAYRLLLGTDVPFKSRFCANRQWRDWIEKCRDFLNQKDLDMIKGRTDACILGLQ